jgi:ABC-type antimicrobial peptide transport system permease subunit
MFRNYFNIAWRSLQRNLSYSFINLAGLSIGIASTLLILLWVHDEVTFNTGFSNYESIHLVKVNINADNGIITGSLTPYPLKEFMLQDSRVNKMSISIGQAALLSVGDKKLSKVGFDASEDFLNMFDFPVIHGQREGALNDVMSIVLTQSTAVALFGTDDVVGKMVTVKIEQPEELKITAVIADPPSNTSFSNIQFLLSFKYFERTAPWLMYARENWTNNSFNIHVQLHPGASVDAVDKTIKNIVKEKTNNTVNAELFLHPMSRWRLYNDFKNGKEAGGLIDYVILFSCIGVFVLLMACINFMNLATARSQHRAREVGVRKSVGSSRFQLIVQFMGESLIMATLSLLLGIVLVEVALPFYNTLVNKSLSMPYTMIQFWIFAFGLILITGIVAGSYPALYLSGFKPAKILKGNTAADGKGSSPRQFLVVVQNSFAILLITGSTIVYLQISHLKNREPGYDRENLMLLWSNVDIEKNYHALKEELVSTGAAVAMTKSNSPVTRIFASSKIDWPGMSPGEHLEATNIATEYDYTKTLGVKLLEGRDFSPEFPSDTSAILINKAAMEAMGLSSPIGQKIDMWQQHWTIIGVMDNVLMGSGSQEIQPLVMTMDPTWSSTITIRLPKSNELTSAVSKVESVFKKYNPDYPFEYRFADEEFEKKFSTIEMTSKLSAIFTVLAIFITALGLFGMAAFTAEQRTKEIGIRKVLGASIGSVLMLLSKDFSKMVFFAFIVATPLAWWISNNFLQQYQIRIAMPFWVFPLAGMLSLAITIIIAVSQGLKAAKANPVKSLRSE